MYQVSLDVLKLNKVTHGRQTDRDRHAYTHIPTNQHFNKMNLILSFELMRISVKCFEQSLLDSVLYKKFKLVLIIALLCICVCVCMVGRCLWSYSLLTGQWRLLWYSRQYQSYSLLAVNYGTSQIAVASISGTVLLHSHGEYVEVVSSYCGII